MSHPKRAYLAGPRGGARISLELHKQIDSLGQIARLHRPTVAIVPEPEAKATWLMGAPVLVHWTILAVRITLELFIFLSGEHPSVGVYEALPLYHPGFIGAILSAP